MKKINYDKLAKIYSAYKIYSYINFVGIVYFSESFIGEMFAVTTTHGLTSMLAVATYAFGVSSRYAGKDLLTGMWALFYVVLLGVLIMSFVLILKGNYGFFLPPFAENIFDVFFHLLILQLTLPGLVGFVFKIAGGVILYKAYKINKDKEKTDELN